MQERRKIERKYLVSYSRVFDRDSGKGLGYLADLSQKGMMTISDEPLVENEFINLRLDLPEPPEFSLKHLDMRAKVTYCRPDVDPEFLNIGFEFMSVDTLESKIIEEMISVYEFTCKFPGYPPSPSLF